MRHFSGISLVCDSTVEAFRKDTDDPRFANIKSLEEIHRILIPGGHLGLIWNVEDCLRFRLPQYTRPH